MQPLPPSPTRRLAGVPVSLWVCACALAAAVTLVYAGGLRGAFLFDDQGSVADNPTLGSLLSSLRPPAGTTVSGRPVLNLSFAVSHAFSAGDPVAYHAGNLVIHALAAIVLFGLVRLTLQAPRAGAFAAERATGIAFAAALLWAVHPLQTESVAYVSQRAESLMGLFFLLGLYAYARAALGGAGRLLWPAVCVASCLLAMGTKEVAATLPLVALLYDRAFVSGSLGAALRSRWRLLGGLAACWGALALLVAGAHGRAGTVGFSSGVSPLDYLRVQVTAVPLYLKLSVWPHPLVGDYGRIFDVSPISMALGVAVIALLVAGSVWLSKRRPALGFLPAAFLVILAPSSSFIPVATELVAEHRMYLPLALVCVAAALGLERLISEGRTLLVCVLALAAGLGASAARRVGVYAGPEAFWRDVVTSLPQNAGAWNNLGMLSVQRGDLRGAVASFKKALSFAPAYATAHANLARALAAQGQSAEASPHYKAALAFMDTDAGLHVDYATALALEHRYGEAEAELTQAARLEPGRADAWFNLGAVRLQEGNLAGASEAFGRCVAVDSGNAAAHIEYANTLAQLGRLDEALNAYERALALNPRAPDAHNNRGILLAQKGRLSEAKREFEEAVRLAPHYRDAADNLARVNAIEQSGGTR